MNRLITKSLKEGKLPLLFRIPEALMNESEKKWVKWIRDYSAKYGEAPQLDRFTREFDFFTIEPSKDPLEDIFDELVQRKRNVFFIEQVNAHQREITDGLDPAPLVDYMGEVFTVSSGGAVSTRVPSFDFAPSPESRVFDYGVKLIDDATGGLTYGDYSLIVGRPGSRKTTFLEMLLVQAMLSGKRVLYISNENPSNESLQKLYSLIVGFNPLKLRTKKWGSGEKKKIDSAARFMSVFDGEIVIPDLPAFVPADVVAYNETYDPDIIAIDGIYLMSVSGRPSSIGWEEVAAASRELKRFARRITKPLIGTIQAGRGAEGGMVERNTIAGTDAFLQDADTVISLNARGDKTIGQVVKSRWGATPISKTFELIINYENMFMTTESETIEVVDEW